MKPLLLISILIFSIRTFGQFTIHANQFVMPNSNPSAQQAQNINYYNQVDDNNNSFGNASSINDGENPVQTNISNQQKTNPAAEQQGISLGNFFGSDGNDDAQQNKPCTDCDEVKQAIKASHVSSGEGYHKKSFSMRRWSKTFSGKVNMKMKKTFARKYKAKTSYALCFNWH